MTNQHPVTPPPELIEQWMQDHATKYDLARRAAQWGANCELEKCCEWLHAEMLLSPVEWGNRLRSARRPKPPSLKEQALKALDHILNNSSTDLGGNTIRRALEQLDD